MRAATATPDQQREIISRRLLRAMGLMVAASLALATYARVTDRPLEAMPVDGPIVSERVLRIVSDSVSGAARVHDGEGALIADLSPTQGGFVAGVWRAVVFERRKAALLEHWLMVVSLQDARLWRWLMPRPEDRAARRIPEPRTRLSEDAHGL